MKMWMSAIFLIVPTISNALSDDTRKCCKFGEILQEFGDSTYACIGDLTKRNSIYAKDIDFITNNPSGSCWEYSTDFYEFQFREKKIINKTKLEEPSYTKCCPIGYKYNLQRHSCEPKTDYEHDFIDKNLVKIGLIECHIIIDAVLIDLDNLPMTEDEFCLDEIDGGYVRRQCANDTNVCDDIRCVKKCCPDGKSFGSGSYCLDSYVNGVNLNFSKYVEEPEGPFAIVSNNTRCDGLFYQMPDTRYKLKLLKNGQFYYWENTSNSYVVESPKDPKGYCIEHTNRPDLNDFFFFNCHSFVPFKPKFQYTRWPKILSCVFLALTILVYLILEQTKKLFGKILINYSIATFLMFALLIYAQFDITPNDWPCQLVGFGLIFLTTVSFTWLNVMCCDIWLTFGSTKNSVGVYQRKQDLKKLLIYTVYGWGMPLFLTLLVYIFSISDSLPYSIRPYVGTSACFIVNKAGNYALFVFLRFPHLLIQLINAFLFMKTILYFLKIKNEIQRINDNKNEKKLKFYQDKEKLFLILKLSIIMGITFIVDTVTAFVDMNNLGPFWMNFEIVVDCFNCLQGVFIFIIFICKKSIYNDFLKKLHIRKRDNYFNNTMGSFTSSTRITLKNGRSGL